MSFSHVKDARFSGWALVVSVIGHAGLLTVAGLLIADEADAEPAWVVAAPVDPEPGGGGDTFDVETVLDDQPGESRDARGDEDEADDTDDDPGEETAPPAPAPPPPAPKAQPDPAPAEPEPDPDPDPDPNPDPDPAAVRPPGPSAAAAKPAPVASAAPSAGKPQTPPSGKGEGKGQSYGAAGLPRGVRHLAPAFTRAIPPAVSGDGAWTRLDLGEVGQLKITVVVNRQGRVSAIETSPERDELPEHLQRFVERTSALLKAGRYALTAEPGAAGRETFLIRITLTLREPIEQEGADPDDALQLGHEPPTLELPGKAYFTYASGRHFQAEVTILGSEVEDEGDAPADDALD